MIALAFLAAVPLINDYRCKLRSVSSTHPIANFWYSEPADPNAPWAVRFSNYSGVAQHVRSGRRRGGQFDKIAWIDRSGDKLTAELEWSDSFGVSGVASEAMVTNRTKQRHFRGACYPFVSPMGPEKK